MPTLCEVPIKTKILNAIVKVKVSLHLGKQASNSKPNQIIADDCRKEVFDLIRKMYGHDLL